MVVGLETEDLESVLEITLAVLMEHHQHLSVLTFDAVQNMARVLARDQKHMLEPMSLALPDLSNIPVLAPIWDEVKAARDGADPEDLLQQIRRRLANDNSVVVEQALQELIGFLRTHASSIQDAAISGQPEELADLDQLLLKMSMKWQVTNERIPLLACRCLGVLGCSDYNRVELPPPESSFLLLSNFEKAEETTNFVIHFIESVLVKIYLSSTNLKAQGLLAYALQELLKFCGFRKTFLARSGTYQGGDQAFQRWTNLPTILKDVLGPLLTSSYVVLEQPSYTDIPYPIYHSQLQYSAWLRLLVLKLLGSGARVSSNAELLFPVFTRIIRNQDLSIPVYLLPYLVLNLVIGGSDIECQSIMQEMQLILQTPVDHSSQASISVKQCSEVRISKV